MKISVIIPTYNRLSFLKDVLSSLFAQTVQPHEIIVVDDGSTDGSWEFLDALRGRIILLRTENTGPGPARNAGAGIASGDYLSFVDSDDIWAPWALEVLIEVLIRESSVCRFPLVYFDAVMFEGEASEVCMSRANLSVEKSDDLLCGRESISIATSRFAAVSRMLFIELGGFWNEKFNSEDTDFALRAGVSGPFVYISKPVCVAQRYHAGQVSVFGDRFFRGIRELIHREKTGVYPGGLARISDRKRWICHHSRSCCWHMGASGHFSFGAEIYLATFLWNLSLLRFAFLLIYPVFSLVRLVTGKRHRFKGVLGQRSDNN